MNELIGDAEKAPGETLDYDFRFQKWLPAGDTILTADVTLASTLTCAVDTIQISNQEVKVWLSGGADADYGLVTCTATTVQGRVKQACIDLLIKDC